LKYSVGTLRNCARACQKLKLFSADRHVLTAAHCADGYFDHKVTLGAHFIDQNEPTQVIRNARKITIHERFRIPQLFIMILPLSHWTKLFKVYITFLLLAYITFLLLADLLRRFPLTTFKKKKNFLKNFSLNKTFLKKIRKKSFLWGFFVVANGLPQPIRGRPAAKIW
jgi:hypothetical protein